MPYLWDRLFVVNAIFEVPLIYIHIRFHGFMPKIRALTVHQNHERVKSQFFSLLPFDMPVEFSLWISG